ncbi:MAG: anti-sigma factor domain-containing protein [Actinomycetota bacterium]|nr:anti-sigma factor domain-containing protein [Actinomycetota bacterium]MDD5600134.1 anti-sigma factor domain-containing protein [Actinomycetota bacterium]
MKGIIIEIGRDYCIVLTRDGQFIKQRIPHGVFEIGDEIAVTQEDSYGQPAVANIKIKRIRSFALAASVILVLVVGSIFIIKYVNMRGYYPGGAVEEEEEIPAEEKVIVLPREEKYKEAPAEEQEEAEVAEEEAEAADETALTMASEEGVITFENIYSYSLVEQKATEENIKEVILFSYKIIDNVNLKIQIKNISNALTFDGTFKLNMLAADGSESRVEVISLDGFGPGRIKEHQMFIKSGEENLKVEVTGTAE